MDLADLSPIAKPLAQKKLLKKVHRMIKKGTHVSLIVFGVHRDLDQKNLAQLPTTTSEAGRERGCKSHSQRRERVRVAAAVDRLCASQITLFLSAGYWS